MPQRPSNAAFAPRQPSSPLPLLPFQAFGFAPIGRTTCDRRLALASTLFALLISAGILGSAIFATGFVHSNTLQAIVAALIFAAEMCTNLVLLVHTLATRRSHAAIPRELATIDALLAASSGAEIVVPAVRGRLPSASGGGLKLWLGAVIMFGTQAAQLLYMWWRRDPFLVRNVLQATYPTLANRVRCLQTVCYTDAVGRRLRRVVEEVERVRMAKSAAADSLAERRLERVRRLKTAYAAIWRVADRLNACFGWSLLALHTCYFIHLTAHGYWLFLTLQGQLDAHQYFDSAMDIGAVAVALGLLCEACHGCAERCAELAAALNKLEDAGSKRVGDGGGSGSGGGSGQPSELDELCDEFVLQVQLEPIVVSASGFFDINRDLLSALAATTITYLVILIQFQISEQNKSEEL